MTRVHATAALISVALVAALVGCSPIPAPTPSDPASVEPTPTETVSETPTPDPVVEPLTIPDCETLLPVALAKSTFGDSTEFLQENVPTEYYPWYQLPPVLAAISGVTLARACWFGIPNSDGSFTFMVAEIDPAARATIEAALDAESFSSVSMGTVTAREANRGGEFEYEAETHLFTGDVWIIADSWSLDVTGIVTGSALDAMRTANPTLGL
jgi:hypothetical protein